MEKASTLHAKITHYGTNVEDGGDLGYFLVTVLFFHHHHHHVACPELDVAVRTSLLRACRFCARW